MAPAHSKHSCKSSTKVKGPAGLEHVQPPMQVERAKTVQLDLGKCDTRKCRTDPQDPTSALFKAKVPHFSAGTAEDWLKFLKLHEKVHKVS